MQSRWRSVAAAALAGGLIAGIAIAALAWPDDPDSPAALASPEATAAVATEPAGPAATAGPTVAAQDAAGWSTYTNAEHEYEIASPPGWQLTAEPTLCGSDGFCVQAAELRKGDGTAQVFVFVNFQGGWCENLTAPPLTTDIDVSGYAGKEYHCPGFTIRSFDPGDSIIRYLPDANGKHNYWVLGQARGDLSEVTQIVRSFRILDPAGATPTVAPQSAGTPESTLPPGVTDWHTYTNAEHAYQIQFPPDWELTAEPTNCGSDGFCVQNIELTKGDAALFVFVNFQGDWCNGSPDKVVTDIVVSGYEGTEYRCSDTIRSFGPGAAVIRRIPDANGMLNYTLWGQSRSDLSAIDEIVLTFRILN